MRSRDAWTTEITCETRLNRDGISGHSHQSSYRTLLSTTMSSTTTETRTRSTSAKAPSANYQAPPQITVLNRVASIPLVSSSLDTINVTLISNAYTCSPYNLAKGLSNTALKISEPIQVRMAPLITRVDCYANMAVDMVESRYPYPFKAKPEEVASLVRERRDSATQYVNERRTNVMNVANKTIDDNLKSPALNVAQGIDQVCICWVLTPSLQLMNLFITAICTNRRLFPSRRNASGYRAWPARPFSRVQVPISTCYGDFEEPYRPNLRLLQ